jgi:hypothetical protein
MTNPHRIFHTLEQQIPAAVASSKTSTPNPWPAAPAFWFGRPAKFPSPSSSKASWLWLRKRTSPWNASPASSAWPPRRLTPNRPLNERLSDRIQPFLAEVITASLGQLSHSVDTSRLLASFARVLVQDSTVEKLPKHLAHLFPGGGNQHGGDYANLKIQWICDLKNSAVEHVSLSGFTRNDQAAAPDILEVAQAGDLVLRDLGYLVTTLLPQMTDRGISFLSRHRHGTNFYDPQTGQLFDLAAHLRRCPTLDCQLLLGPERAPVRLVALPVPPEVANLRRHRAKASARRRHRSPPGKEHLFLMSWNLFLTNVPASIWPPKALVAVYRLRWRIEIVFKTWKSHLGLSPSELSHHRVAATLRPDQAALLRVGLPDVRRAGTLQCRRAQPRQPVAPGTHPRTMCLLVLRLGAWAGSIGQGGQFAEHGQIDRGAQGCFELRQRGDGGVLEERLQPL